MCGGCSCFGIFVAGFFFPSVASSRKPHGANHNESSTRTVTVALCRTCTEREKINSYVSWKLSPAILR